jgi:uncharacterized protein YjbI with pentapeptide repeats
MANPDHIAQLMKGVAAWNAWRKKNRNVRPNISRANLRGANLSEIISEEEAANLRKGNFYPSEGTYAEAGGRRVYPDGRTVYLNDLDPTDLVELIDKRGGAVYRRVANLSYADLTNADLSEACLTGANLVRARLDNANLSKADLSAANLYAANLSEADLSHANLGAAYLGTANLQRAKLIGANLFNADLTAAILVGATLREADPGPASQWTSLLHLARPLARLHRQRPKLFRRNGRGG